MGSEIYGIDNCRGRRASKELHLPVLPGAWALGDGLDVQLLEEFRSRGRAQSPAPPRQSGSGSPSVWSSLLESLTGALDLSGGWEYSRSDSNRQTASRSGSGGSAGGGGPASSSTGTGGGADGVVLISSGTRSAGGGLMHRSCSTSGVPSVASVATTAAEAPAPLGRTNSGGGTAAPAGASRHYDRLLLRSGRTGSGGSSAAASARTSACGLPSTAASSGMGSATTTCSGMSAATNIAGLSLSAGGGYMNTSASTPIAGRSTRSSGSGGCTSGGFGSTSGASAVTFGHLALLPASGCADRDLIDSVLASPRDRLLGVPAQVSVCKQD